MSALNLLEISLKHPWGGVNECTRFPNRVLGGVIECNLSQNRLFTTTDSNAIALSTSALSASKSCHMTTKDY